MSSEDVAFVDAEEVVRLLLTRAAYHEMLAHALVALPKETGGVLVGVYQGSSVIVRHASPPPEGSRATRTSFSRGTGGLVAFLQERWRNGEYYVGEWHAHPGAAPTPSCTDLRALEAIAREGDLGCATPVVIIVGGTPHRRVVSAHVRWSDGLIERLTSADITLGSRPEPA